MHVYAREVRRVTEGEGEIRDLGVGGRRWNWVGKIYYVLRTDSTTGGRLPFLTDYHHFLASSETSQKVHLTTTTNSFFKKYIFDTAETHPKKSKYYTI